MQTTPPNTKYHQYRPDIDGLRAIAIVSVVIFHAFREYFNSGFIGVDIFFVISGFLISTILFSSLESNTFSIVDFYIKRIRRIFPALITVMLATLIVAWFILFSDEFERFGKHLTAGIAFVSNIVFWRESGYFDSISETKPLLHFWSLAIEEQFYLFWPIMLAFLWYKKLGILKYITIITAGSFLVNIFFINSHPVATFFLPVTRVWQLMIGGVLAYIMLYHSALLGQKHNLLSALGFFTLIIGFLWINDTSPFPGWWALLPTFGTALIISAGSGAWLNKVVLSNKPMIWIGKISYPLYLWHWPILSFLYIINNGDISNFQLTCMLITTVLLSWATYLFIEKPLRFGRYKTQAIPALLLTMLLVLAMSLLVKTGKISPRNDNPDIDRLVEARNDNVSMDANFTKIRFKQERFYNSKHKMPNTTLFIGDSHALQYVPRISYLLTEKHKALNGVYLATHEGCLPVPGMPQDTNNFKERACNQYRNSIFELLKKTDFKTIVLTACWNCYLIQDSEEGNTQIETNLYAQEPYKTNILKSLKTFLSQIQKTKTVYLVLDNPASVDFDPSHYLEGNRFSGFSVKPMAVRSRIRYEELKLRDELIAIAKQANVNIIDPLDSLCIESECLSLNEQGLPIYKDTNHLRATYVEKQATYIDEAFLNNK